jgi:hypothetical protein
MTLIDEIIQALREPSGRVAQECWWTRPDSNWEPSNYEFAALTSCATGPITNRMGRNLQKFAALPEILRSVFPHNTAS